MSSSASPTSRASSSTSTPGDVTAISNSSGQASLLLSQPCQTVLLSSIRYIRTVYISGGVDSIWKQPLTPVSKILAKVYEANLLQIKLKKKISFKGPFCELFHSLLQYVDHCHSLCVPPSHTMHSNIPIIQCVLPLPGTGLWTKACITTLPHARSQSASVTRCGTWFPALSLLARLVF